MYQRVSITRCLKMILERKRMKAMITPSNKLSCNLLKSKKSKIRQRLKKKRSKKRRPKPMVKKPKKRRSKRMVDQLSSKMENHQ